jgi:hypothetical protein
MSFCAGGRPGCSKWLRTCKRSIASICIPEPCPCELRTCSLGRFSSCVFAALQGGIYAASSAAKGAQTLLGVDATVAVAVLTPPRELEARVEPTRAEAEVTRNSAAYSEAGAARGAAAGEQSRKAATEVAARIAEVEAEAARRVAVSSEACDRGWPQHVCGVVCSVCAIATVFEMAEFAYDGSGSVCGRMEVFLRTASSYAMCSKQKPPVHPGKLEGFFVRALSP